MSTVRIGQLIKERVDASGMSKSEFARRINTTPQNAYGIFKRKSIDTDMLKRIGEVLGYDFFNHYHVPDPKKRIVQDPEGMYVTPEKMKACQEQLQQALKEIEYLKKINELLESQVNKGK